MKKCYKCGTPLAFKKLPNGRWLPMNTDGSDHFDLCSKIRTHRLIEEYRSAGLEPPSAYVMTDRQRAQFAVEPDFTQPWFVGVGLPWADYAPVKCGCGEDYEATERDCSVTLFCQKCATVRIETSYTVAEGMRA